MCNEGMRCKPYASSWLQDVHRQPPDAGRAGALACAGLALSTLRRAVHTNLTAWRTSTCWIPPHALLDQLRQLAALNGNCNRQPPSVPVLLRAA